MLFGRFAGTVMPYGAGLGWPIWPNAAPLASPHLKLLISSSTLATPRWLPACAATSVPSIVSAALGVVIDTVGGGMSDCPASNTLISFWCEFWVPPHRHRRASNSPQVALALRKTFC